MFRIIYNLWNTYALWWQNGLRETEIYFINKSIVIIASKIFIANQIYSSDTYLYLKI
jgi:hypothetical protein